MDDMGWCQTREDEMSEMNEKMDLHGNMRRNVNETERNEDRNEQIVLNECSLRTKPAAWITQL